MLLSHSEAEKLREEVQSDVNSAMIRIYGVQMDGLCLFYAMHTALILQKEYNTQCEIKAGNASWINDSGEVKSYNWLEREELGGMSDVHCWNYLPEQDSILDASGKEAILVDDPSGIGYTYEYIPSLTDLVHQRITEIGKLGWPVPVILE